MIGYRSGFKRTSNRQIINLSNSADQLTQDQGRGKKIS